MPASPLSKLVVLCAIAGVESRPPEYVTFPQRTNAESALLEWGHSAVIHAADAVVAQFGLQAADEEFELGIEASPVFAKPSQGCEPLRNADELQSQVESLFSAQS